MEAARGHALQAIARAEAVLLEGGHGWANTDAMRRIREALRELDSAVSTAEALGADGGGNVRYKADELRGLLDTLYSARKHARFRGGADGVRQSAMNTCMGLRMAVHNFIAAAARPE